MMTKEESLIMKGLAILLMLFLHLFNQMGNVALTDYSLTILGKPLVCLLARAANPVAFFLMLSGYGLYVSHSRGKYNVWSKLKSLYIHYWITLAIFVTVGFFVVGSQRYPGDWAQLLGNATGWLCSYNGELWFLFPYILVMLTSGGLVRILNRFNSWACTGVALLLSLSTGFVISRYGAQYLYGNRLLYNPVLYVSFLFPFTLGAYMAKYHLVSRFRELGGDTCFAFRKYLIIEYRG